MSNEQSIKVWPGKAFVNGQEIAIQSMTVSTLCQYCGTPFSATGSRGPKPKFCKPSHRRRQWEQDNTLTIPLPKGWAVELDQAATKRKLSREQFAAKALRRVLDGERHD